MVEQNKEKVKQLCPDCGSSFGYMRLGKVWVCRNCGEITQLNKEEVE